MSSYDLILGEFTFEVQQVRISAKKLFPGLDPGSVWEWRVAQSFWVPGRCPGRCLNMNYFIPF